VHNAQQLLIIVFSFAYAVALLLLFRRWLRDPETDASMQDATMIAAATALFFHTTHDPIVISFHHLCTIFFPTA
jgi:hypothetical protein